MANILVVDDEEDMREVIAYNIEREGHSVRRAASAAAALREIESAPPDLIVSDIMMPGMDGLQFCSVVRGRADSALTPFLFVTAKGQLEDKVRGLGVGADDYITKPFELPDLLARVRGRLAHRARVRALEDKLRSTGASWEKSDEPAQLKALASEQSALTEAVHQAGHWDFLPPAPDARATRSKAEQLERRFPQLSELRRTTLIGDDPEFLRILPDLLIAASSSDPTLVLGETGTGKTAVAEAIWSLGPRASRPFATVNCSELAAGDPTIALGKLFGYGKNSGLANLPKEGQPGMLELNDGGVLFLDEVGALPAHAQAMLLLPLEGRAFRPAVGSGPERTVDVKFVLATNRDLVEEVEAGGFPRDLYERIAGETIGLPPLRERRSDIPILVRHFVAELSREEGAAMDVGRPALEALAAAAWPGNVRELRRVLRNAVRRAKLAGHQAVQPDDLPDTLARPAANRAHSPAPAGAEKFSRRENAELEALRASDFRVGEAEKRLGYSSRARTLSHRLRGLCLKALSLSAWDVDAAARLLAGGEGEAAVSLSRRLRSLLDGMAARLDEPDERVLAHLLAEHRDHALEALRMLRRQR